MPKLSNETKRFLSLIFMPGLMFSSVCVISWLHKYLVADLSPEDLVKTVTVGEGLQSITLCIRMFMWVIGVLFSLSVWVAAISWITSRQMRTEEAQAGELHATESD